jgi:hypothetical protein
LYAWRLGLIDDVHEYVDEHSEIYTVHDRLWKRPGMRPWGGCLCIGCLERRLGRWLKPKDFDRDHAFNRMPGTPRLLSRRGDNGGGGFGGCFRMKNASTLEDLCKEEKDHE